MEQNENKPKQRKTIAPDFESRIKEQADSKADNERWKSDGNCKYCRRIHYCGKVCAAAKMREYRKHGIMLRFMKETADRIKNRNDALIALTAVDKKSNKPHTMEELDVLLARLEAVAARDHVGIDTVTAGVCVQAALNHIDLDTVVLWMESEQ